MLSSSYRAAFLKTFKISTILRTPQNLIDFKLVSTGQTLRSNELPIVVEVKDQVQWIRLNRPKQYNAMNNEAYDGLISALDSATANENVKLAVITGTGKYFSSGNDFNNHYTRAEKLNCDLLTSANVGCDQVEHIINTFIDFPKPLVGAINGPAYGIMVTTLAFYDYIFASNTASFTTPFSKLGITPEGCSSYTFPRILGPTIAAKMLSFSETLSVEKALQLGFITEVVQPEELENKINDWLHHPKKGVFATCNVQSILESKALIRNEQTRKMLKEINKKECDLLKKMYDYGDVFKVFDDFKNNKNKK